MNTQPTPCQVCGADIAVGPDLVTHELIDCTDCGTEFEVTVVAPLTLIEAPVEEEDWGQ